MGPRQRILLERLRIWWAETMAAGDLMDAYRVDDHIGKVQSWPFKQKVTKRDIRRRKAWNSAADWAAREVERRGL